MKNFLLLFSMLLCFKSGFTQTLTASPTTVVSGNEVTVTGVGESQVARFSVMYSYALSPANSSVTVEMVNGSLSYYSAATLAPTTLKLKLTSTASTAQTVSIWFHCAVNNDQTNTQNTNYQTPVTITVSPAQATTYYNVAKSGSFTRNNCGAGTIGSTVTYTVAANTYSSTVSQAAADNQAIAAVNANGQAFANANGQCLTAYYNSEISASFIKNDCPTDSSPSATTYNYTVAANSHVSTISQADADSKALNDLNTNGQINANNLDVCNDNRLGYKTKFRSSLCDDSSDVRSSVWLKVNVDLTGISFNSYATSGIYAYTNQTGDTRAAAGYYTDLYSDPSDGAYIRVFQVGPNGELVSYSLCSIP